MFSSEEDGEVNETLEIRKSGKGHKKVQYVFFVNMLNVFFHCSSRLLFSSSIFNKDNFVEEEAELSGSEVSSDEDEGSEDDQLEEDSDVEDLPSDEELQRQVNKVHM